MFKKDFICFLFLDFVFFNDFGDSLFYVIVKIKFSKILFEVIRRLCEKGVKLNIKNSEGRFFVEYLLNENDRCL